MLTCVTSTKHESITFKTGPYFAVRVSFVTSAALVGGRLNGLRSYDKRADRKRQTVLSVKIMVVCYDSIFSGDEIV